MRCNQNFDHEGNHQVCTREGQGEREGRERRQTKFGGKVESLVMAKMAATCNSFNNLLQPTTSVYISRYRCVDSQKLIRGQGGLLRKGDSIYQIDFMVNHEVKETCD